MWLGLLGCQAETWRNADIQLDINVDALDDEATIRVCVADVGVLETATQRGLIAFPGVDLPLQVTVQQLSGGDPVFSTDEIEISEQGLTTTDWGACSSCEVCRAQGVASSQDQLLAIRLLADL